MAQPADILDDVLSRVTMRDILHRFASHVATPAHGDSFVCRCPMHDDKTASLSVNDRKMTFKCHAGTCGQKGGALDLVIALGGADSRKDALAALADLANVPRNASMSASPGARDPSSGPRPVAHVVVAKNDDPEKSWSDFAWPPAEAPVPAPGMSVWSEKSNEFRRLPSAITAIHRYAALDDRLMGYVLRCEKFKDGQRERKWFVPLTWGAETQSWEMSGFPHPRPYYGIERICAGARRLVLVEGEKTADQGQLLFDEGSPGETIVLSVSGGSEGGYLCSDPVALASVLAARPEIAVYVWPDADRPDLEKHPDRLRARSVDLAEDFTRQIAAALAEQDAARQAANDSAANDPMAPDPALARVARVFFVDPDPAWPDKFDLADARDVGLSLADIETALASAREISAPEPPPPDPTGLDQTAADQAGEDRSGEKGDGTGGEQDRGDLLSEIEIEAREEPRWLGFDDANFYALAAQTNKIVTIRNEKMSSGSHLGMVASELYWRTAFPGDKARSADWGEAATRARAECYEKGVFLPSRARGRGIWEIRPEDRPAAGGEQAPQEQTPQEQAPQEQEGEERARARRPLWSCFLNTGRYLQELQWTEALGGIGGAPRLAGVRPFDVYGDQVFVSGLDNSSAPGGIGAQFRAALANPPRPEEFEALDKVLSRLPYAPRDLRVGPVVLRGWMALAPLNGLLPTRPHLWLTGASGSGKTWIATHLVRKILDVWSYVFARPVAEKTLAARMGADALPVILDDLRIEDRDDAKKFGEMIRLARACAQAGDASDYLDGETTGVTGHVLRSTFLFVCPEGAAQSDADASRFVSLGFGARNPNDRTDFNRDIARPAQAFEREEFAIRFLARSIFRIPAILEAIPNFIAALSDCERRIADLYAPLLAGWFGHAFEGRIDSVEAARAFLNAPGARAVYLAVKARSRLERISADDERDLLRFLQCAIDVMEPESRLTLRYPLSQLIAAVFDGRPPGGGATLETAQRALVQLGVRVLRRVDPVPAARNAEEETFPGDWEGGVVVAPEGPLVRRLQRDGLVQPDRFFDRLEGAYQTARLRIAGAGRTYAWLVPISYFDEERVDRAPRAMLDGNVHRVDFRNPRDGQQPGGLAGGPDENGEGGPAGNGALDMDDMGIDLTADDLARGLADAGFDQPAEDWVLGDRDRTGQNRRTDDGNEGGRR